MPRYLNTRGNSHLAVAICDRCGFKKPYDELGQDGNVSGLRVCRDCYDPIDPWRLPARKTESITVRNPRPDTRIGFITTYLAEEHDYVITTEDGKWLMISDLEGV